MKIREFFHFNKPGHPAKLAAVGIGILVLVLLVTVLCIRFCRPSSEGTDPTKITEDTAPATPDESPDAGAQTTGPSGDEEQEPVPESTAGQEDTEPSEAPPVTRQPTEPMPTDPTPTEPGKADPPEQVTTPSQAQLVCSRFASFSGAFVEDGSDEPVENVAAVLVTNTTDNYLDLGQLTCQLDGQEVVFRVTGLPAGASAWVMEASRKTAGADSVFTQPEVITSFRKDAQAAPEGLTVASAGATLKVTNNRDTTLRNVTVYYKVLHSDGNYFGGITYMSAFGDLEPGQSAEKLAGHFKEGITDIVRIGYQEAD